ncbi:MAG: hemolysin family protein [Thermoanaerobaculaceae bacterium]|nr:hemolysin family protein [Thermoanaerobaculaceae bacterium]TAM47688.1 MAG: HlyC/CorC family transporter [Acidobacteriota bacterium]
MTALALWWANPITAVLTAFALLGLLVLAATGMLAVVRLGAIQLGGLLVQRATLLPGLPRRSDAQASVIVFLQAGTGLVLVLFSLVAVRAGRLVGASQATLVGVLAVCWLVAVAVGLLLARGARVERLAVATLVAIRPWTALLRLLARFEGGEDAAGDGGEEEVDEHEVQAFIGAGEEAGILEREDAVLVASIVELSDTVAREIMTPRTDMVALPAAAGFADVERLFADSMFTRIPVYRETLDRIEGVVHVKDVLRALADGKAGAAADLLRPVLVVPETKPLRDLLREFQAAHQQIAVVVDEYGGTSGIVTLEDILEEIVGEIQDEHQRETPEVEAEGNGAYLVDGAAHVGVLEDLFGAEVGEVGFDSVAGLVLDRLGHVPRPGERTLWNGLDLEVVDVDRRRLRRVRVRRHGEGAS